MGKPPLSAVYFVRTPEVDEFLEEFIRVRSWHILENMGTSQSTGKDTSLVPRRRNVDTNSDDKDEVLVDDMLDVAKEMSHGSSIHLDAFISLVVNHNEFIDVLTNEEYDAIKPKRFKLYEIMKNTSITDRKIPKPRESTDLQSVLREAEERRYQRLVSNVQSKFKSTKSEVSAYKPPIIDSILQRRRERHFRRDTNVHRRVLGSRRCWGEGQYDESHYRDCMRLRCLDSRHDTLLDEELVIKRYIRSGLQVFPHINSEERKF
uniref:Uncharacterized protein n=1 Tax=Babesia bovis TaxID=5865 RepID=A7APX7_BABBO|eukprot:XP_001612179.1 hypothetical protein [Babesia bovis T2Bo]